MPCSRETMASWRRDALPATTPSTCRRETREESHAHNAGEEAIKRGLAKRVSQLQDEQERRAKAAAAENAAFSAEFLGAARRVFAMIDVDNSGTLTKEEIKKSVKSDKEVIDFLKDCGEENLQFLLEPKRLDRALNALDTSQDGEVDVDEWCVVRVRKEIPPGRHRCDRCSPVV